MIEPAPLYLSYLLRLWLAGDSSQPQWRLSLEDPRTGERQGFNTLEELVEFLKRKIEEE
jgi:hypothetical protein